jgi:tripartite-type tricarboxylate transporter receptor subunit TctC
MKFFKIVLMLTLAFVLATAAISTARAESGFPEKPISLIVPYSPGGGFDTQARILAPYLKKHIRNNVEVVVRNVTGAGGRVGSLEVMKSDPDGYTIGLLDTGSLAIVQVMGQMKDVDITKDLLWLGRTEAPGFMAIMPSNGSFAGVKEYKGQKVRLAFTTQEGAQSILLLKKLGAEIFPTAFAGTRIVMPALMRNDADVYLVTYTSGLKYIASSDGKLKAGLICRLDRRPELPNTPNLIDIGAKDLAPLLGGDRLLAAPAGLPQDVHMVLADAIGKATTDPEWVAQMKKAKYIPSGGISAEEITALVGSMVKGLESTKDVWGPVLMK